ncbi:MAG: hypothetical protein JOY62_12130 [Acidobacteriaceae bacterium]|nr:hypothetical protein [Acidobacteriaceae bacterium]MBV9780707.1 hypothetical protein [Acidobacteriaceae bacterium]
MRRLKVAAFALGGIAFINTTGCNTQPNHPNQLNAFDGTTYDMLTVAHAALVSFRTEVTTDYPQYASVFNEAAAAYSTVFNAYSLYRRASTSEADVAVAISKLTVSIVSLENAFQSDMHVAPETVLEVRKKAKKLRGAAGPNVSISDVLTELEIAAAIAESIPGAQPYSRLAEIVIAATQQAVAAERSISGQAIDLSTIEPIASIP